MELDRVNAIAEELLQQLDAFQSNQHHSFVTTQQMAREAATVIRLLQAALQPSGQTLPKPGRNDGGEPCGECHLQPGETCDICGAAQKKKPTGMWPDWGDRPDGFDGPGGAE